MSGGQPEAWEKIKISIFEWGKKMSLILIGYGLTCTILSIHDPNTYSLWPLLKKCNFPTSRFSWLLILIFTDYTLFLQFLGKHMFNFWILPKLVKVAVLIRVSWLYPKSINLRWPMEGKVKEASESNWFDDIRSFLNRTLPWNARKK